ncbi:hypothetical protein HOE425_100068 [Hoeflea sp. EC-HK425]|nr:hypothetical protein HOE425_100068 [Hoeflea sp. EC-HK425]
MIAARFAPPNLDVLFLDNSKATLIVRQSY